ncbi:hypothetical protein M407DRAFT_243771 [Tulasnella calospora MUT 4182]|uniref:Peptidase S9 prolyl oligopeptidase catalytic domain-containing protein n=1 Tax=Tulasnella calospora MUT 4182 TaxID=1051891 RepID=A0A0C3QJG2_9AGAM|nr:hypothetical protein M407DRAFT_243771 [Tulasnella calospora MUT 4182]
METQSITVVFLLHGRMGSTKSRYMDTFIARLLGYSDNEQTSVSNSSKGLVVVTFDHRNHGTRMLDETSNFGWAEKQNRPNNKHALDMYTLQVGAVRDISFLIDFLPSYLYPTDERHVVRWGVIGVSLGGHAAWIALKEEPRLSLGIPIIGCPNYLGLMEARAIKNGIATGPPIFPESLRKYIVEHDPVSVPYKEESSSNPFVGKHILVSSGGADELVPWEFSKEFVEGLVVGKEGVKRVFLQDGIGHSTTPEMMEGAAKFVASWLGEPDI